MGPLKSPVRVSSEHMFEPVCGKTATRDEFVNPRSGKRYEWLTFRTSCPPPVAVFAMTSDELLVAVRQYRHGADEILLELPGGLPEREERPWECAIRELMEETGYAAGMVFSLAPLPVFFDPASYTLAFLPFLAQGCKQAGEQRQDDAENIEVVELTLTAWFRAIRRGEVRDAKSLATTMLAADMLSLGRV